MNMTQVVSLTTVIPLLLLIITIVIGWWRSRLQRLRSVRPKLDPRLSFLLRLSKRELRNLKKQENQSIRQLSEEIQQARRAIEQEPEVTPDSDSVLRLRELENQQFAPLTTGIYLPELLEEYPQYLEFREPYISAFISSDASVEDLVNLGVKVRCQSGDIFTAYIPLSAIPRLEDSPAIRFIKLARPLFPDLDQAVPYAQIDQLHAAVPPPPLDGSGVIVGIVDPQALDIYHPDFRTATGSTRVLFLWDQTLDPKGTETGPPPGLGEISSTYGVEYDRATIDSELNNYNPSLKNAYQTVRHKPFGYPNDPESGEHGTLVAGIAVGNGLGQGGTFTGAAPAADIVFVKTERIEFEERVGDDTGAADAFKYIFARAAQLSQPCVINMSSSDNQGPHDGSTMLEDVLDDLLLTPGRAITLSAGNSNNMGNHAAGTVREGDTTSLILNYKEDDYHICRSDAIEIWYDGHDSFSVTVTIPTIPDDPIGPLKPDDNPQSKKLDSNLTVEVSTRRRVNLTTDKDKDLPNLNNCISIIIKLESFRVKGIPSGDWIIALTGDTVINGNFHAWLDRNNSYIARWQNFLKEDEMTLGVPATARRAITVGNHDVTASIPNIDPNSGRGPTRDGRIKPEIASVGVIEIDPQDHPYNSIGVMSPRSRNMNEDSNGDLYYRKIGTSISAPLVAGACALLFQCRGANLTWANLKQILEDTASKNGLAPAPPNNAFGFGFMQMANACVQPAMDVDVWLRDYVGDTGVEPGPGYGQSPDIEVLDKEGNIIPVPNATYHPTNRYNNIIRVKVRNRGTQTARNTEVYFYWADPATYIPFPEEWKSDGIYTGSPDFLNEGNKIVIPELAPGEVKDVKFAWAPPAPSSSLNRGDHFCLLVRLENEADPSQIDKGGWSVIVAKNNIALHNVYVKEHPSIERDIDFRFYVIGSRTQDSLLVQTDLIQGQIELNLPIQALPWRDMKLLARQAPYSNWIWRGLLTLLYFLRQALTTQPLERTYLRIQPRLPYGLGGKDMDPLTQEQLTLKGTEVKMRTDILGADRIEVRNGIAAIRATINDKLFVPHVHLVEGAKMPANIRLSNVQIDDQHRFVHVTQLSGGQVMGTVTLELRPE